jgi:crotonobetainyl-CoA:carnitine CoA-transferase CaiB-like acyl-CoA transferase
MSPDEARPDSIGMSWLKDVRILDCTRLLPHAYATQMLVALGAEVIKIESPGMGEYGRGMAPTFAASNGRKASITLDLKSGQGREIFRRLADSSACVVESFRPGVMRSAGLDFEALSRTNPALIYCSATGYGQSGPYVDVPGHDLNYLGLSGVTLAAGSVASPLLPIPVVDMAIGPFLALSVIAAIAEARATGIGQAIDISLMDVAISFNLMGLAYTKAWAGGLSLDAGGTLQGFPWPGILIGDCPSYGVFRTADGKSVSLCNVEEKFWVSFLSIVGLEYAPGDRFATGERGRQIRTHVEAVIGGQSQEHWIEAFAGRDVCFAPVLSSQEVMANEHVKYRESVFIESDGSIQVRFPGRFSATPSRDGGLAPTVGENTYELLRELGYDDEELARLAADAAI